MATQKLLFIFALFLSMHNSNAQESNQEKFKRLEWLTARWVRTNSVPGQSGYETWSRISDSKLSGKGVTLKGNKVIFTEDLDIIAKGADIFYVVKVSGEEEPVSFKLTSITNDGFSCENQQHDFPKRITYTRSGNHVKAVVSGNGKSINYIFVREEPG